MARCLAHEPGAWQEFMRRYSRLIYGTVNRVDLPASEQEEAFQASMAAIYRELANLRDPQRPIPWIVGIAWRQAINCIRRRPREVSLSDLPAAGEGRTLEPTADDAAPDEVLLILERAQQAREALLSLGPRCRRLLGYLFYEDPQPSYAEIARRESLPIGSLGPTRARCLARMRLFFERRGWL